MSATTIRTGWAFRCAASAPRAPASSRASAGTMRWTRSPRTCCGSSSAHGAEAVWPYCYAGTMGLVQRDGIERLTHVKKYSRFKSTICVELSDTGFKAGHGRRWGVPATEIAEHSDLIVVWGTQPGQHPRQPDDPHRPRPQGARARSWSWSTPTARRRRSRPTCIWRCGRAPTARWPARVMHVLFEEGFADRDYLARYSDVPEELERAPARRAPRPGPRRSPACPSAEIVAFARLYGAAPSAPILRLGYGFTRSRNGAAAMHAASCLPVVTGAWQHAGRRGPLQHGRSLPLGQDADRGPGRPRPSVRAARPVADRPDPGRRAATRSAAAAPVHALLIQNTNPMCDRPRPRQGAPGLRARRPVRRPCTSSS